MSYFNDYFNLNGVNRGITPPLLERIRPAEWMVVTPGVDAIERLLTLKRIPLVSPDMSASLKLVDPFV
jgi:hypothetical protein